jgi:hypothetical protein
VFDINSNSPLILLVNGFFETILLIIKICILNYLILNINFKYHTVYIKYSFKGQGKKIVNIIIYRKRMLIIKK